MKSTVSVIVAAYNMEAYLAETLESILASSYRNLEVVVMDDGSSDATPDIIARFAARDPRIVSLRQQNQGVCHARNNAIRQARGEYILPVDADNLLKPWFIAEAVEVMQRETDIKAVVPQGEFFGERTGLWQLPEFSLRLLARKNIIDTCALYRRADWERAGGYCPEIIAREDWEFWIAVLKDGGRVVRTQDVGLMYRIRKGSKRQKDRQLFRHVVDTLNRRHPEFFERELGGPLRYQRTWSRLVNGVSRFLCPRRAMLGETFAPLTYYIKALPQIFLAEWGTLIHDRRNQLRRITLGGGDYVVKSFAVPNIINRIAYGFLRPSKAQRSYDYTLLLRSWGIGSPEPVAWLTERRLLLFARSYYVSRQSELPYSYNDIIAANLPPDDEALYLAAIAQTTARLHDHGCLHSDYSRGNILFGRQTDGSVAVELIDLNRLRFRQVSVEQGCANLAERLPMTDRQRRIVAAAYAAARHADAAQCEAWMRQGQKEFS